MILLKKLNIWQEIRLELNNKLLLVLLEKPLEFMDKIFIDINMMILIIQHKYKDVKYI